MEQVNEDEITLSLSDTFSLNEENCIIGILPVKKLLKVYWRKDPVIPLPKYYRGWQIEAVWDGSDVSKCPNGDPYTSELPDW